jgi:hypothetical protein
MGPHATLQDPALKRTEGGSRPLLPLTLLGSSNLGEHGKTGQGSGGRF